LKSAHWIALALLCAGIAIFGLGFFLSFFWMEGGGLLPANHVLDAGAKLEFSWYMERGDRAEGSITVSGGNEEARYSIRNPSGVIVQVVDVKGRYDPGFKASDFGVYSFIFENLDSVSDQNIFLAFVSPDEPRLTRYDWAGLLMMVGSVFILCLGVNALDEVKSRARDNAIVLILIGLVVCLILLRLNYYSDARF
jgi:hypothetical protein